MLAAVNKQRATQGLKALCLNSKLNKAAKRHSDDMAAKDYMAHDGSDGSKMSERITDAGYEWDAVAENVAAGQVDVDAVMVAWINSPEHLVNIMGDYTMLGTAYAYNANSEFKHYWTQDFGSGDAEACDGAATTQQDAAQSEEQVQGEADALPSTKGPVVTPAPTTSVPVEETPVQETPATVVPETEAPSTEVPVVTPAPTTLTPTTESPKGKDCESNF
ncbi:hypothetical protein PHYBOEH_010376 [Phytophthora boehmeriae]|uniref:SCP domain-containing protein n=1 Tax=Phytophthora boehmeriae TaxID=109152 RepID=A0A8T1VN80_9STRA|nr:hypothetical protein PHYBOEH_010376 [Phytophthora boehmeriae]